MKRNQRGFTLIELIGVLVIIAVLASAIAPNIAHEIRRAIAEAEDKSLMSICDALGRAATETHSLPGAAAGQWDAAVAPYLDVAASEIVENKGSGSRRLVIRPTNGLTIPYDQAARFTAGTLPSAAPLQARMLIVSNLSAAPPAAALTDAQFDAVWNQTGAIPNGFTVTEKFRIARAGFASLFHPVTLTCTSGANSPQWSIDAAAARNVLAGPPCTVYLFTGTRIDLFINSVSTGAIVVNRPIGISYDGTRWSY